MAALFIDADRGNVIRKVPELPVNPVFPGRGVYRDQGDLRGFHSFEHIDGTFLVDVSATIVFHGHAHGIMSGMRECGPYLFRVFFPFKTDAIVPGSIKVIVVW